jgi:signal transduction histidine kinase
MCERLRIEQVLQNLIGNAVKYNDKETGLVSVDCTDEGRFYQFSISDNGPGIEEKYFEKIFQIFQTLVPRDKFESTGIGLSIVKKIVETWKGKIWVESDVGKGSTFYFTLPK